MPPRTRQRQAPDLVRDINGFVIEVIPPGPGAEDPPVEYEAWPISGTDGTNAASTLWTDPDTFLISSTNPLPSDGRDGDVLVMRDGRAQWVAPTEAFRAEYQYENGKMGELQVVARQTPSHSIPRPPEPPPPPKKYRTAWEMLMDDEE